MAEQQESTEDSAAATNSTSNEPAESKPTGNPVYVQRVRQGIQYYQQQDLPAAMQEFDAALTVAPDDPNLQLLRGVVLRELGKENEAETVLQSLIDQRDVAAQALMNLSLITRRRGDRAAAKELLRSAIAKNFQFAPAHFNLALALLEDGNFREGFREYEWRWHTPFFKKFPTIHPRWDGQQLDATLLVHTEQGTEDTVHFCRYLPMIRKKCNRLVLVCSERMASLFPSPEWADEVLFPGEIPANLFQAYLPLLSAPLVFHTDVDSIPADVPYLNPPEREFDLGVPPVPHPKLRVGIAWGEGPADIADANRYCSLADFAPLLQVPDVAFYSLQQGTPSDELKRASQSATNVHDVANIATDLAELASLLKQFDLVISPDSTTAHLAGALGIPTWILLSRSPHWRWMRDREDSPWYPTMRLFRQQTPQDWSVPIRRAATELSAAVADRSRLTIRPLG